MLSNVNSAPSEAGTDGAVHDISLVHPDMAPMRYVFLPFPYKIKAGLAESKLAVATPQGLCRGLLVAPVAFFAFVAHN